MAVAAKESGALSFFFRRFLPRFFCASILVVASYIVCDRFNITTDWRPSLRASNSSHYSSSLSVKMEPAATASDQVLVDFKKDDYRGFLMVCHEDYGLLMLRCTRKKNKPPHWQLPGGHVDHIEFQEAAKDSDKNDRNSQLLQASKRGASRELFEETGIDLRTQLDRLQPANLHREKGDNTKLINEYKHRLFFTASRKTPG